MCLGVLKGDQTWAGDVTGEIQALERQWGQRPFIFFPRFSDILVPTTWASSKLYFLLNFRSKQISEEAHCYKEDKVEECKKNQ